jgi:hypothetical protein
MLAAAPGHAQIFFLPPIEFGLGETLVAVR